MLMDILEIARVGVMHSALAKWHDGGPSGY